MKRAALIVVALVAGAACGGERETLIVTVTESGPVAPSPAAIEQAVAAASVYEAALCEKTGIIVFVGEREDVYACDLYERAADLENYGEGYENDRRCFVVVDGSATDVTDEVAPEGALSDLALACSYSG